MSFYTAQSKSFKFPSMPDNKPRTKRAFALGFVRAVAASPLSANEKVAWMKYAAGAMPPGGPPGDDGGGEVDPVAGPGPGFVPEGAPEEQQIQQLLEALPGNSAEEKLHAAVVALLEAQQGGGGDAGGVEDPGGGVEGPGGQIDPALLQQLLSQGGGQAGGPPGGGQAGGPPPGPPTPPPGKPPVGGPQG